MLGSGLAAALIAWTAVTVRPPVARSVDEVVVTLHGEARHDEYAWLRAGPDDRAVRRHLAAENRYAEALMRPHAALMRTLEREIEARTYVDHESVPERRGAWLYWTRTLRRADHPIFLRRRVDAPADARPQVVLDLNALARGKPFFDLGTFEISDDGRYLAYAVDEVGGEDYTLFVKDLETGALGPERLSRVTSAAWSAGGRTLLFTVQDDTLRSYALRAHTRGEAGQGRVIYTEDDPRFDLEVSRGRSGEWLFLGSDSYGASEVRVARADQPEGTWTVLAPRKAGHLYTVDHAGDTFYVRTNLGAPNFRVMTAPEREPQRWTALVPERPGVALVDIDAFDNYLVISQRESGRPRLALRELASGRTIRAGDVDASRRVAPLSQSLASVWLGENPEPGARSLRVHVESAQAPETTLDIDLADGVETIVAQRPGPCGGTTSALGTARAADGTQIHYLEFHGEGARSGPRALLLEGYGAYGSTFDPDFDPGRCALLDRGVDFVIAWVRGGGELGEPWHDAGRLHRRPNAVADFVAVAEHLIASGKTTPAQLVAAGDSAGGALVAGAVHARPELFAAAVLRVPFLDALGTMADRSAPLTTMEYEEWGDPAVRADYDVIKGWCPYTNVGARDYPPLLVESSLADSRVAYHEQARYVARMRARGRGGPFMLRTEIHAGHGGASARRAWLRARAFEVAFILTRTRSPSSAR